MPEAKTQEDELKKTLETCLDLDKPRSFFLYAGAGSGKTRAVVSALKILRDRYSDQFRRSDRKIAVITYTNAACDEIRRRIDFDPIITVSTIHSFAWEQIRSFHKDISAWLCKHLDGEIEELIKKQDSGRRGTKASADRDVEIAVKQKRRENLDTIKSFTYNPNGENIGKNSLNHTEVIALSAAFLAEKQLMRQVLVRKYPVLIVDESQDTQKDLIEAFLALQARHPNQFILALFGDTMQRIYSDGKVGLEIGIPADWKKPAIKINHRCPKRIVKLLNLIRKDADGQQQTPREDAREGFIRLFLVNDTDGINKQEVEDNAAGKMAQITLDQDWTNRQAVKVLTLEHHMAARRGGFGSFFDPLYKIPEFRTSLLDGTQIGSAFFIQRILPLVQAMEKNDRFAMARIIRNFSPIVSAENLKNSREPLMEIRAVERCVQSLFSLWRDDADPLLIDILKAVSDNGLFEIPDVFLPIIHNIDIPLEKEEKRTVNGGDDTNTATDAWREALQATFKQFRAYEEYISDKSRFGTHQGIKGLQFPRVMVILDDNEARGFLFSYEKLLGVMPPTTTDEKNKQEGKDTSIDRTRRLFYVTCSRAQESLAVVVYTKESGKVEDFMKKARWFESDEIIPM